MGAVAQQSYVKPLIAAVAEGATTPNPGTTGAVVLSSTTGGFMRWTGSMWTAAGTAGTRGTYTFQGAGTPTSAAGIAATVGAAPGDHYIDTTTDILYQLSGFTGTRGAGTWIFVVADTPSSSAGIAATTNAVAGDFYINSATGALYQLS